MIKQVAAQRPNLVDLRDEIDARRLDRTLDSSTHSQLLELMRRVSRSKIMNGPDSDATVALEVKISEVLGRALRNSRRDKDGQGAENGNGERAISAQAFFSLHKEGLTPREMAGHFGVTVKIINELHEQHDIKPNKKLSTPESRNPESAEEQPEAATASTARKDANFKGADEFNGSVENRTMGIIGRATRDIIFLNLTVVQDLRSKALNGIPPTYSDKIDIVGKLRRMKEKAAEIGTLYMSIGKSNESNEWIQIKNELGRKSDQLEGQLGLSLHNLLSYLMRFGRAIGSPPND